MGLVKLVVLPPGVFFLALLTGLVLANWRRALGVSVAAVALLSLYVSCMPLVATFALHAVETGQVADDGSARGDAIVVLAGDFERGEPPQPGALTVQRLRAGATLHRRTGLPILVSGGPVDPVATPAARIMKRVLTEAFAVPVAWTESESRSTWTNAARSAAILRANGISRVHLVTQRWHLPRAAYSFRAHGIAVVPAPASPPTRTTFRLRDLLPHAGAMRDVYFAAHEALGLLWYRLVHRAADTA